MWAQQGTYAKRLARAVQRWLLLLFALSVPGPAGAADRIALLHEDDQGSHRGFVQQLRSSLQDTELQLESFNPDRIDELLTALGSREFRLVLSIGTRPTTLLHQAAAQVEIPTLAALVPSATFRALQGDTMDARSRSVIFLDQPVQRWLALTRAALPHRQRFGALLGPSSADLAIPLTAAVQAHESLATAVVAEPGDVLNALHTLLQKSDLLLAFPDPVVFNATSAKGVLLTTYRHKIPVVAYSKSYVKAGALLAIYSSPEQVARQVAEVLKERSRDQGWDRLNIDYPKYFSIAVNHKVARSLEIPLPDKEELERMVTEIESLTDQSQP